jgi:hypothetical protein
VVYGASNRAGQLGGTGHPRRQLEREADPKGWSVVLVTTLGSYGTLVPLRPFYAARSGLLLALKAYNGRRQAPVLRFFFSE